MVVAEMIKSQLPDDRCLFIYYLKTATYMIESQDGGNKDEPDQESNSNLWLGSPPTELSGARDR